MHQSTSTYPYTMRITLQPCMFLSIKQTQCNYISTLDFCIWQHFGSNWTTAHIQKLVDVPEAPITQLYNHMIGHSEPILPFEINRDTEKGPSLTWKLLTHPGTNTGTISMISIVCIVVYCLKGFWCDLPHLGANPLPSLIVTCYFGWWCRGSTHLQK